MSLCGKVNFLISRMQKIDNNMENLAIMIKIRKYLSGVKGEQLSEEFYEKLLKETKIMSLISMKLKSMNRYIILESLWILVNLTCGNEQNLRVIFSPCYQILEAFDLILSGNDFQMINLVLTSISNALIESQEVRREITSEMATPLTLQIASLCQMSPPQFILDDALSIMHILSLNLQDFSPNHTAEIQ